MRVAVTLFFSLFTFSAIAQYEFNIASGNFSELKGQTAINVEFDYDGMIVGDNDETEAKYIETHKSEHNAKEPGRGDNWEKIWHSNKKDRFEPKFHELLKKYSKIPVTNDPNSKYTLIVHVKSLRTGFVGWGFVRSNAKMSATISLIETQNKNVVPTRIDARDIPGRTAGGYDFNASDRLTECFAKAGKETGKLIATGRK